MSYEDLPCFVNRADKQPSARSALMSFACSMLKKTPLQVTSQGHIKDEKREKERQDKADKDRLDKAAKDKLAGTVRQPAIYTLQGSYVYELLVGPGVSATDQARQLAITQGKSCPNCLDYKSRKYPLRT